MGPDAVIFVFWLLSFKPAFLLSSSTFIKGLSSLWISFDEFVGEKVVSLSYSSTILAPSSVDFFHTFFFSDCYGQDFQYCVELKWQETALLLCSWS